MFGVMPLTPSGLALPVLPFGTPPFDDRQTALKPVIAAPLFAGLVNDTLTWPVPRGDTCGLPGRPGAPTVTTFDAVEGRLVPCVFVAATVHRYCLPVVTPATPIGAGIGPLCPALRVVPPLFEVQVAVNVVTGMPTGAPAWNETVRVPVRRVVEPDVAVTAVGEFGMSGGVAEVVIRPIELLAKFVNHDALSEPTVRSAGDETPVPV